MILAVIDTNILVSSMIAREGNEAYVVRAIRRGLITPCVTPEIIDEYNVVLSRPKFEFEQDEVAGLITLFKVRGFSVRLGRAKFVSPDPTDTKFIGCAISGLADFLVTGNRRHFPASPYGSTVVVSARELLVRVKYERPPNL